jgi:hypothetical protein
MPETARQLETIYHRLSSTQELLQSVWFAPATFPQVRDTRLLVLADKQSGEHVTGQSTAK